MSATASSFTDAGLIGEGDDVEGAASSPAPGKDNLDDAVRLQALAETAVDLYVTRNWLFGQCDRVNDALLIEMRRHKLKKIQCEGGAVVRLVTHREGHASPSERRKRRMGFWHTGATASQEIVIWVPGPTNTGEPE